MKPIRAHIPIFWIVSQDPQRASSLRHIPSRHLGGRPRSGLHHWPSFEQQRAGGSQHKQGQSGRGLKI